MARISEDTGEENPLQVRVNKLAAFIGIVVATFVLGVLLGRFNPGDMKNPDGSVQFIKGETSVLTVAVRIVVVAVLVGLLLAVILIVAYAVWKKMAAKAWVRRLSACEIMGSAKAIFSEVTGTLRRYQEGLYLGPSTRITVHTSNRSSSSASNDVAIMDSAPTAPEDATAENSNSCDQEGSSRAKKVRRAGRRRSRAKAAIREQGKAIQPTPLLTGLQNHPSIYIRLGRPPPIRGLTPQNGWNRAFDIWSTAAEVYKGLLRETGFGDFLKIRPIMINLPGYMCALAERYFSETHTLHLGTFEIGPTPLAWAVITGIRFRGDPLNPPDITPADCAKLLGLEGPTGVISEGKVQLDALCPSTLDFSKDPTDDDRDWMFRRLIVYLVGSCFFSGTDLMVPIHLVSAMSNIQRISQYDWGAATFSAFLRGMRVKTSQCSGSFSGFYPFLLFWAYEHLPCMRPVTELGLDTFPRACRWESTEIEVSVLSDFICYRLELEYTEEDQVNFNPYREILKKGWFQHEALISQKRIAFQGLDSWEVYMGERNLRQFVRKIQIPHPPPAQLFSDRSDDVQKVLSLELHSGVDAQDLVEDEGRDYADWFRTHSLGRIVQLEQVPGRFTLGYKFLEPFFKVHRDGHVMMTPQDLQSLRDTSDKWEKECQRLETTLKPFQEESRCWKEEAEVVERRRKFWEDKYNDAKTRAANLAAQRIEFR